jgi:hypothetical protein
VQIAALERKHEDKVACGEIETAHPGYLGAQDFAGILPSHIPKKNFISIWKPCRNI